MASDNSHRGASANANLDARRKQMIYRANHRGIKEMDIMLGGFAEACIGDMSEAELDAFEALMAETDRDLLTWFTGEVAVPEAVHTPVFDQVAEFQAMRLKQAAESGKNG
ncbi:MAG: succinate dehydrogenase assembly factor 2 [Nitratireductor sp.]